MTILYDEILEQPETLQRLLDNEALNIEKIAKIIIYRRPLYLMIAGRGSSDNAARYGQYLFGAHNQLPVALAAPSLFTLYQSPPYIKNALLIAISQSGQSPDICAVLEEGRHQGALTIAMTNDINSPLAAIADECIDLHAGQEKAIAASKTYTSSLVALAMLSTAITHNKKWSLELQKIPDQVARTLQKPDRYLDMAGQYRHVAACVTIGRGYNYATAFEIALKIKELAYILAEPYSTADFQHGPVALVQDGFLVLAVTPLGATSDELIKFLTTLRARGAKLAVIASGKRALSLADSAFPLPRGLPEWLSPIVAIIPGQLFASGLAHVRGLDPDNPRGLSKITRTR